MVVGDEIRSGLGMHQEGHSTAVAAEKIARFTQYVVRAKAKELMCRYLKAQLEAGVKVVQVDLRSRWFSSWRHEYGLSLRKPNRRYKVSRAVLAERLQIGWLNVYRVRAAVAALKSYDPHMENWDQSPFHHNETGSENKPTLAVAGLEVPLVGQLDDVLRPREAK